MIYTGNSKTVVVDAVGQESCWRVYDTLQKFNKGKKFFYIKPNYSLTACRNIEKLIKEKNGKLISCMPWSMSDVMRYFFRNRFDIRKQNIFKDKKYDFGFLGNAGEYKRPIANFTNEEFYYPIYGAQFNKLAKGLPVQKTTYLSFSYPNREDQIKSLENLTNKKIMLSPKRLETKAYIHQSNLFKINFQPPGVGIRHAIYECMMFGNISLIPECSYITDIVRKSNFICDEFITSLPDGIMEFLNDEALFYLKKAELIYTFEKYMRPKVIIGHVFKKIEEELEKWD